jgi:hypothetical protein
MGDQRCRRTHQRDPISVLAMADTKSVLVPYNRTKGEACAVLELSGLLVINWSNTSICLYCNDQFSVGFLGLASYLRKAF